MPTTTTKKTAKVLVNKAVKPVKTKAKTTVKSKAKATAKAEPVVKLGKNVKVEPVNGHKKSSKNVLVIPKTTAKLDINISKTCDCKDSHINCLEAKEWMKNQLGVWEFYYEKRD